jgi:predicted dehydrogenase
MKIGIIGTGRHGSRYAAHIINDIKGLSLTAISRRSDKGKEQAEEFNCTYHKNWQDLISNSKTEAIIGVTPPSLNLAIAKACAAAGKPLLIEKPLATNLADGEKIVKIFNEADLKLTVAQTLRYNPVIQALKKNFHKTGKLYSIIAQQHLGPSKLPWLEDPCLAGYGVTLHIAIHVFDALRYISGLEVKKVRALSKRIHTRNLEDFISADLEFSDKTNGIVQASKISAARTGQYQFIGKDGILQGDQTFNTLEMIQGMNKTDIPLQTQELTLISILNDWKNFLNNKSVNPIPGKDGLEALKICMACIKSFKSKKWEAV